MKNIDEMTDEEFDDFLEEVNQLYFKKNGTWFSDDLQGLDSDYSLNEGERGLR